MPRNGSGSYSLPAGNPFVPSTVISSTTMNNTMNDLGTALTQSIANDGQTTPVANLPMATFRHTNVGNAVARNDYASAGQVQDSSLQWLTSVAGTNTITATITPSPTAYTAGQTFRFTSAGANTGAVTLNINGLGAKSITKNGTIALVAGDIAASTAVEVTYDGTQFQLLTGAGSGRFLAVQAFTASGTYTPTPGTRQIVVMGCGGGGAGGGSSSSGGGCAAGAGGGGAAEGWVALTTGFTPTVTVTIGAGGAGSAGANGGNGGSTTFGALMTLPGGSGGSNGSSVSSAQVITGGAAGASAPSGSGVIGSSGNPGGAGVAFAGNSPHSGIGGSSKYGAAGRNIVFNGGTSASDGGAAGGFGGGGGGAASVNAGVASAGGAGTGGIIIVYEYS